MDACGCETVRDAVGVSVLDRDWDGDILAVVSKDDVMLVVLLRENEFSAVRVWLVVNVPTDGVCDSVIDSDKLNVSCWEKVGVSDCSDVAVEVS